MCLSSVAVLLRVRGWSWSRWASWSTALAAIHGLAATVSEIAATLAAAPEDGSWRSASSVAPDVGELPVIVAVAKVEHGDKDRRQPALMDPSRMRALAAAQLGVDLGDDLARIAAYGSWRPCAVLRGSGELASVAGCGLREDLEPARLRGSALTAAVRIPPGRCNGL